MPDGKKPVLRDYQMYLSPREAMALSEAILTDDTATIIHYDSLVKRRRGAEERLAARAAAEATAKKDAKSKERRALSSNVLVAIMVTVVGVVAARHPVLHPAALLQEDREEKRARDGQPDQLLDLGEGVLVGLRRLGRARQRRDPRVAQDVLDAGGQPLVDDSGQAGHAAAIERLECHRGVAVASVLAAGQEIVLQRAHRARCSSAELPVDAGPQIAEGPQVLLQALGERVGWSRSGPQLEPGLTIRTPHRPSQPANRRRALSTFGGA